MKRTIEFTLIELLVVVAIIGILASLLFPAIKQARDRSLGLICLENLKQSGLLVNSYADDNMDLLPACMTTSHGITVVSWPCTLFLSGYVAQPQRGAASIFVCPSYEPKVWDSQYSSQTYGLWVGDAQHGPVSAYVNAADRYHLSRRKLEDNRIIIADTTRSGFDGSTFQACFLTNGSGVFQDTGSGRVIHLRHFNQGGGLFVDCHAEFTAPSWLANDARYNWRY